MHTGVGKTRSYVGIPQHNSAERETGLCRPELRAYAMLPQIQRRLCTVSADFAVQTYGAKAGHPRVFVDKPVIT